MIIERLMYMVQIRKMEQKDIKQVQKVAKTSWNATYEGIIPPQIQENFLQSAYNTEMMNRRLEQSHLYVAENGSSIVGFANFSQVKENGDVELGAIYIEPDYRGKGIGTSLLLEGQRLVGIKKIYINVEKENVIGLTFYKAKGFEIIDEFDDDFDGHILKTIRMVLEFK